MTMGIKTNWKFNTGDKKRGLFNRMQISKSATNNDHKYFNERWRF